MSRSILFIEDEYRTIKEFGEILELNGDRIEVAEDGPDAARKLSSNTYDLVVLDIMLPHGTELPDSVPAMATGLGLLMKIRKGETKQSRHMPVVVLTATADSRLIKEVHHHLDPGIFLHKPVSMETFLSSVDCALLSSRHKGDGSGWSEDTYQKEMVEKFSSMLLEIKSSSRTGAVSAGLRSLAQAMDCELVAVIVQGSHGLRAKNVYTPDLAMMDLWSGSHLQSEGLLREVLDLKEYRAVSSEMDKADEQLARMGIHSALAVPFSGYSGKPSILLVCNRRPYAKHEAHFLSYDGELCRLYAEHLLGPEGAVFAPNDEEFQIRLTKAAREIGIHYDDLWRKNGRNPRKWDT